MVTLIFGVPNSGKTTYSKRYENVIHLDDVEPVDGSPIKAICEQLSNTDGDVAVEGVILFAKYRKRICEAYKGDGKRVCIWLNIPLEECERRENRGRGLYMTRNCHDVIEPPTYDEGWDEIIELKEVPYV